MQGRYGVDQFNRFLFGCSIAFLLLSIFAGNFMYVLALACLIYSYFRMLSKNTQKRYKENLMYVGKTATGKAELKAAYEAERGRFQH